MSRRHNDNAFKAGQGGDVGRLNNDYVVLMAVDTGALGSMFIDGIAAFEDVNLGTGATTLDRAAIGALPLNGSRFDQLNGDLAELIIFDTALSAADQNAIGFYLGNKYSIDTTSNSMRRAITWR